MKKVRVMILVLLLVMTGIFTACGEKKDSSNDDTKATDNGVDNSLQYVLDNKKLILGLDDAFPPMGFRDDNQDIVGFDIDVAKEVCKRMGVELVLQPISWSAKEEELKSKNIDCIWNGFTKSAEREEALTLSIPYMKNTQVAVVLADSKAKSLDDLAGKTVVIQNGSSAADAVDSNKDFKDSLGDLVTVADNVKALMDLTIGGSDAVVMDEVVARYYTEKQKGTYKILDDSLADEEYVVGFRKGDDALANEINKYLREMKADGTLAEICEKWMGKDITIVE